MKSVLISIHPKWCDLIARGEKTLEVRKTRPKIETPFKCYIYCTLSGSNEFFKDALNDDVAAWNRGKWGERKGNVIGEFICDTFVIDKTFGHDPLFNGAACMTEIQCAVYSCRSPIYGWHISDLRIYEKPKSIEEFRQCYKCPYGDFANCQQHEYSCNGDYKLKRPPQSWCYVEEI